MDTANGNSPVRWIRARSGTFVVVLVAAVMLLLTLSSDGRDLARTQTVGLMLVTLVASLGLNLLSGYSGLISLGQGAFVALGAYGAAFLRADLGLPWLLAALLSLVVCGILGAGIAVAAARLHGPQLAMVTLVFAVVVHRLLVELPRFGRLSGYPNRTDHESALVDPPELLSYRFEPPLFGGTRPTAMFLIVGAAVVAYLLYRNLAQSPWGRSLRAIQTSEIMASQVGINVSQRKISVSVLAAVFGGAGGVLYLLLYGHLQPESFTLFLGVNLLVAVILGGSGTLLGPVVGSVAVAMLSDSSLLDEVVSLQERFVSETWYLSGEGLVALIMLFVLLVMPRGIWGTVSNIFETRRRLRSAQARSSILESDATIGDSPNVARPDTTGMTTLVAPDGELVRGQLLLEVTDYSKRFGGNQAVHNMNLSVASGEVHAIIGPNGAGKSTLANLISGLYRSDSGRAELDGIEIDDLESFEISRIGIGRTFQTPLIDLEQSCLGNVLLGAPASGSGSLWSALLRLPSIARQERVDVERAGDLLAMVGLEGFDDVPAGDLSYGQQRSLEVARALAGSPQLIIMDEPGAGLNPHERMRLADLIKSIRVAGVAVVVVEHHMDLVRSVADRVTCMAEGTTLATGSVDAVLQDPAVVASYLGKPSVATTHSAADEPALVGEYGDNQ
jgi:branched-chain amino acid transport system permease protein